MPRIALLLAVAGLLAVPQQAAAADEAYLDGLSGQLDIAGVHLDEASAAITHCNSDLIACLQSPEPDAQQIDLAAMGLAEVRTNLTAMTVPERHAGSHAILERGFQRVVDGLGLYTSGLREADPNKLLDASDLIRLGREDIRVATSAILANPGNSDLLLILAVTVIATAIAIGGLSVVLMRIVMADRRERIGSELAKCPQCGEVLDQFWTFRKRQIRAWLEDHLSEHEREREDRLEAPSPRKGAS